MKSSNEIMLGDAIKELLKTRNFTPKLNEVKIQDLFIQTFGQHISKHLISVRLKNDVVFINLDSASLKHQLSLTSSKLIDTFNIELGAKVITKIVFM